MKSKSILLLFLITILSSFTTNTNLTLNDEILLSVKKITNENSLNILFFENGSCSIQRLTNGEQTSSTSIELSEADLKSLKKIITRVRPIELSSTYTCSEKKVNKKNATVYSFAKSKKMVVVNNKCQTSNRLNDLKSFIERILEANP